MCVCVCIILVYINFFFTSKSNATMGFTVEGLTRYLHNSASKSLEGIYYEQFSLLAMRRYRSDLELLPDSAEGTPGFSLLKKLSERSVNCSVC